MPLLQMKSVPVMDSYNEAAIDVPPELLVASGQTDSARSSPGLVSNSDGQSPVTSPMSDMQSPGAVQLISDWDTDQVGDRQTNQLLANRQTDRHTDRHTYIQTDRQTD